MAISHNYHAAIPFTSQETPMDAATTPKVATVKLLINGQFVESKTTQWRDVLTRPRSRYWRACPLPRPTR